MTEPKPTYDAGQPSDQELRLNYIKQQVEAALERRSTWITLSTQMLADLLMDFEIQITQLADLLTKAAGIEEG